MGQTAIPGGGPQHSSVSRPTGPAATFWKEQPVNRVTGIILVAIFAGASATVADTPGSAAAHIRCLEESGDVTNCPLAGHTEMMVVIEQLSDDGKAAGLTMGDLRTLAARKLSTAGVKVTTLTQGIVNRALADYLYVNANVLSTSGGRFAFCIVVEFNENYRIDSDSVLTQFATSWDTGSFGVVDGTGSGDVIRSAVGKELDDFVNNWLKVNPQGDRVLAERRRDGD